MKYQMGTDIVAKDIRPGMAFVRSDMNWLCIAMEIGVDGRVWLTWLACNSSKGYDIIIPGYGFLPNYHAFHESYHVLCQTSPATRARTSDPDSCSSTLRQRRGG